MTKPFLKTSYMVTNLRPDVAVLGDSGVTEYFKVSFKSVRASRCMESWKCCSPLRALILFETPWDWGSNLAFKLPVLSKTSRHEETKLLCYSLFHLLIQCQAHPFSGCWLLGEHHSFVLYGIQIPRAGLFPLCMHRLGDKTGSTIKWR